MTRNITIFIISAYEHNGGPSVMYGKAFASMYEGSMVGAGFHVFAVWNYVIAKMVPDKQYGTTVTLNPKVLGPVLGGPVEEVEDAINFLCSPDPDSTTPNENGKRLIKVAQFEYHVVNGSKYRAIRDEEERRKQNREAQARYREKKKQLEGAKKVGQFAGKNVKVNPKTAEDNIDALNETQTPYGDQSPPPEEAA